MIKMQIFIQLKIQVNQIEKIHLLLLVNHLLLIKLKSISKSKKNNNQILNYENIKKEKFHNENIFLSNENNDFLAKLLMNETNISISN